ncbi:G-protein coupled receptor family C group 6 member A [Liparis tanakae]|uniref:G-protein coupled receptor family C group 6 member A n=1 Tax=Liparis tanakae TaxID=230148 RepID=A0A4Z2GFU8_9TELE|nr:G-protein coupled receptor family C group 6 member A [Liparis tanakae]
MFLRTQVMIYAIREINQRVPRVLPNVSIGYEIYDTCGDVSFAIRATLQLLRNQSDARSCLVPEDFQTVLPEPETKAVIGESSSEVSIAVARVLALSSVTQIGYAATSQVLSRKLKFPTFLRTIPSDEHQTKAIVDLVVKFNWKTVIVVGSDDEHGRYGSDNLEDLFRAEDICVEFIEILPGSFYLNNYTHVYVTELIRKINESSAEAVILFTGESNVAVIMEAAIQHGLNRTWIATNTWSTSNTISTLLDIEGVGEVFGFVSKRNEVPGFKDYVLSIFNGPSNSFLKHYLDHCADLDDEFSCLQENGERDCSTTDSHASCLADYIDRDMSYSIYLAVEVIALGLRSLLKCDDHHCKRQECKRCSAEQYSSPRRNECISKTVEFLQRSDPFVCVLSALAVLGIAVTVAFAAAFTVYWGTPVVKAVGGYLCLLELLSLLLCFSLTFSFAGRPTGDTCMVGLPLYGIAFSLCIACILANLLQISLGFSFEVGGRSWAKRLHQPAVLVTIVTGIQVGLCMSWLVLYPPRAGQVIFKETILKQCEKGSNEFFIAMLTYNSFLALVCFVFAFKGRKLPDLYKNARLIAVSMLLFLIVWVFLIPIYISLIGKYKRATESTAILISSYSILGCHLAPKCYIMVFKKELNDKNAIAEYIRKHYEQSGTAEVTSAPP